MEQAFGLVQHPLTEALGIVFRACGGQLFEVSDEMGPTELKNTVVGFEIGQETITAQNSLEVLSDDSLEGLGIPGANLEHNKHGGHENP
jgi:hypothetical protein